MSILKTLAITSLGSAVLSIAAPMYAIPFTVTYDFENATTPFVATIGGSTNLTASEINAVNTVNRATQPFFGGTVGRFFGFPPFTSFPSLPSSFISFTVTPNSSPAPGFFLNLSSFTFQAARENFGPTNLFLTTSLTGSTLFGTAPIDLASGSDFNRSFDVSSASFDNITTPVEFRIYGAGGDQNLFLENVILAGDIQEVPYEFEAGVGVLLLAGYFGGKNYFKSRAKKEA